MNWGVYEAAIRRWEAVLGRPTPHPTQPGNHGRPVLAPAFVEHLMGLSVSLENDRGGRTQSPCSSSTSDRPSVRVQQVSCTGLSAISGVTSEAGNGDDVERIDWGEYESAIRRWEAIVGRPAPHPTQPGRHGRPVLSARFVEFLMGLDDGFVSSLDIPRTAQLRALGNGVVPQQAVYAIRLLLADLAAVSGLGLEGEWAA
ncbi:MULTISPECIES: hypothetical protein [Saccharothrix]|uniref:hypothetical protein n=1 Tax=Saccharothrix TaxID=2071 RepID=UPI001F5264BD|nr:hypothetical protein [Saccharothrix sp. CB00851]